MTSEKQIEANRHNAQLSTGPTSEEGKEISRRNAIKHGMTAETIVFNHEDAAVFEALRAGLIDEYGPTTALASQLVDRLAGLLWRLNRIPALETAIFEYRKAQMPRKRAEERAWNRNMRSWMDEEVDEVEYKNAEEVSEAEYKKQQRVQLGEAFAHYITSSKTLDKMGRYEKDLASAVERTIQQLERLKEKGICNPGLTGKLIDVELDASLD